MTHNVARDVSRERFVLPVNTRPLVVVVEPAATTPTETTTKQTAGGKKAGSAAAAAAAQREGNRSGDTIRPSFIKTGVVSQSSGSSYVEFGRTKVIATVQGPRQKTKMAVSEEGRLTCDMRHCTFSRGAGQPRRNRGTAATSVVRARGGRGIGAGSRPTAATAATEEAEERESNGSIVCHALEPSVRVETIPKSIVDLNVLVTEDDGAAVAAACVACSVALADAGIELRDVVSACTVAKVAGRIVVDPTAAEERMAEGGLVVALMPSLNEVTQLHQYGELSQQDIADSIELCLDGCNRVHSLMKRALLADFLSATTASAAAAGIPKVTNSE